MQEYIIELSSDDENALSIIAKAYNLHELIRCKDCKHGRIYYRDHVACDIIEHPSHGLDWYCADGERRNEADE